MPCHDLRLPRHVKKNIESFTGRTWLLDELWSWYTAEVEDSQDRFLLLTADPGAGKSMLVAWVAGCGPAPEGADMLEKLRAQVKAAHFLEASSRGKSLRKMALRLRDQLVVNLDGYAEALRKSMKMNLNIDVDIQVEKNEGAVTGVYIENLNTDPELWMDQMVLDPLELLYETSNPGPILLLIDALDEADENARTLLATLEGLPDPIHVLFTSRADDNIVATFRDIAKRKHLEKESDHVKADIYAYVLDRLKDIPEGRDLADTADAIATAAQGTFLYASFAVDEWNEGNKTLDLPDDLAGFYRRNLTRIIGTAPAKWDEVKPVLGLVAVGQGDGLTRDQLKATLDIDPNQIVYELSQFISGDRPEGPFSLFHKSFSDFLLDVEDQRNIHFRIDEQESHAQLARFYLKVWQQKLLEKGDSEINTLDPYAMGSLTYHLDEAGMHNKLFDLIDKPWMLATCKEEYSSYGQFLADVNRAWDVAIKHPVEHFEVLIKLKLAKASIEADIYRDSEIEALVWLGKEEAALASVRVRQGPDEKAIGLLRVYKAWEKRSTLRSETGPPVRLVQEMVDHIRKRSAWTDDEYNQWEEAALEIVALAGRTSPTHWVELIVKMIRTPFRRVKGFSFLIQASSDESLKKRYSQEARTLVDEISDIPLQSRAFAVIAMSVVAWDREGSIALFEEAEQAVSSISSAYSQGAACCDIALLMMEAGNPRATEILQKSKRLYSEVNNPVFQNTLAGVLIPVLIRTEMEHEALLEGLLASESSAFRDEALKNTVCSFVDAGRLEQAIDLVLEIEGARHKAWALSHVAVAHSSSNRELSEALFKEAIRLVRAMEKDVSRGELLGKVAIDLAHAGMPEAEEIFNDAVREIRSSREDVEMMRALAALSVSYSSKDVELSKLLSRLSIDEMEAIRDPRIQANAMRQLADFVMRKGNLDGEKLLLEGAQKIEADLGKEGLVNQDDMDYWSSQDTFSVTCEVLFKQGQIKEALEGIGPARINPTIELLAKLSPEIDALKEGLSTKVLKEAMRVAGWVRPEWADVYQACFPDT